MEPQKHRILIIDDDEDLSLIISDMLEYNGFSVTTALCGEQAAELLSDNSYHVILLDINLPDNNGFEICRQIRENSVVPVIFASARKSEIDRIKGYDIGGDDYLSKPYSMQELLARIRAIIRRTYGFNPQERIFRFGDVTVNLSAKTVEKNEKRITLSPKEFELLSYLCSHKNTALSRNTLISEVWGVFSTVEPSTLAVHIRWLREKLEDDPAVPIYIKTVYRVGYILEVPDEN